jgi:hypothetical protein
MSVPVASPIFVVPAKAGTHLSTAAMLTLNVGVVEPWVPIFAGTTNLG